MTAGNLIYDIGAHKGEDTDFYMRKGFRVVGVEADPTLAAALRQKFSTEIADGKFILIEKAIAATSGEHVTFYTNPHRSVWGTLNAEWAKRNEAVFSAGSIKISVETITLPDLIKTCGAPYYIKIDIEGSDVMCLSQLMDVAPDQRPQYVSLESSMNSMAEIEQELKLLQSLGYSEFKIVPQHEVHKQKPPQPAREGHYSGITPTYDSSGHFGEEAPGHWLGYDATVKRYRHIFILYALNGVNGILNRWAPASIRPKVMDWLSVFGFRAGWYDTHARKTAKT